MTDNAPKPVLRIDGRDKVTGSARFPSDEPLANAAHAFLVTSRIARGRIVQIDVSRARSMEGVLDILTHESVGNAVHEVKHIMKGGQANSSLRPLASAEIAYAGQIVAVVVAQTEEIAREAARHVQLTYEAHTPVVSLADPAALATPAVQLSPEHEDPQLGDAEAAWANAAVRVEARYATPPQHHNPIELFTTASVWQGSQLTIFEPTRFVTGVKHGVAQQLGIDPADVRVVARYLGGHFGSKFALSQHTALIALAARRVGRPVKLVPTRDQCFTIANHRSESNHHLKLAAAKDGRLTAFHHEASAITSRHDAFLLSGTEVTSRLYGCPNIRTRESLARVDRNTPGPMRAPPEVPYLFALESAMDELAVALDMDPIELRRVNDTRREPIHGKPYSTRPLMACFDAAAKQFGWAARDKRPRSMRDGAWLIGWGCASAMRPVKIGAAAVRVKLSGEGRALVQTAHHEIGNGAYTIVAMTAAEALGIPLENVKVQLGDSDLPVAGVSGGSTTTTSLCHVVVKACEQIQQQKRTSPNAAAYEAYTENIPEALPADAMKKLSQGRNALGDSSSKYYTASFGAHFVEVRVHELTAELHVARLVSAFAAGRIVNPITARSQLQGGMVFGIGSALYEATEIDRRLGRYVNTNLADYLLPTQADVPDLQPILIADEDHHVNPLGLKGLGELGLIGVNAAIANAVYHATGRRIRSLPIRVDALL